MRISELDILRSLQLGIKYDIKITNIIEVSRELGSYFRKIIPLRICINHDGPTEVIIKYEEKG